MKRLTPLLLILGAFAFVGTAYAAQTVLRVYQGGTGVSTFGGTNFILYTTAADTLSSEAAFLYNATANLLTVVNATTTSINASQSLHVGSNRVYDYEVLGFAYASSTQGTGTTTRSLAPAPAALTFVSAQCDFSSAMMVRLYDGTNEMASVMASSTVGTYSFSVNNTFTSGEVIRVDIGTTTASLGNVYGGCRLKYRNT